MIRKPCGDLLCIDEPAAANLDRTPIAKSITIDLDPVLEQSRVERWVAFSALLQAQKRQCQHGAVPQPGPAMAHVAR